MEEIVVTLHKQIVKSMSKTDRDRFNDIFSQMIALQSAHELLKGLTQHKKLVVMRDALAEFDLQKQQLDVSHLPIYTFATKAAFNSLLAVAKMKSSPKLVEAAVPALKNETSNYDKPTPGISTVVAKLKEVSITEKPKLSVSQPKEVKKPTAERAKKVYRELCTYLGSDLPPYRLTPYIQCKQPLCSFCRTMFQSVALTRCVAHKKCVPSGWFPHVGSTLWKSLAKKHDATKIFQAKTRTLKDNEMAPLALHVHQDGPSSTGDTPPMDTELPSSDVPTAGTSHTQSSSPSPGRKTRSNGSPKRLRTEEPWDDDSDFDLDGLVKMQGVNPWDNPKC